MTSDGNFEIFLVAAPGLERVLFAEARAKGFPSARYVPGGVTIKGGWRDVWRANLEIRGAGRVMASLGSFPVPAPLATGQARAPLCLAQRAASRCAGPRRGFVQGIPHLPFGRRGGARRARDQPGAGLPISPDAEVCVRVRIENDLCSIGVDTSGELLHKRGHKEAVAKAPMRETMASLFLRQCGYDGNEPVVDPMCGSGTFVIEAAEIAAGLMPGRSRRFAFEQLATFDAAAWKLMRDATASGLAPERREEAASGLAPEQRKPRRGLPRSGERKPRRGLPRSGEEAASGLAPERREEAASGLCPGAPKPKLPLLRQRPRCRCDQDEPSQRRARGRFRDHRIPAATRQRPRRAGRTSRPRYRQSALRHAHRREAAPAASLSRARADVADPIFRLARRTHCNRRRARPRHRLAVWPPQRPGLPRRPSRHPVLHWSIALT